MKWYKRLFWKIFAAIWSVSFAVLLATICVVSEITEEDRFKEVITAKAEGYAELMIGRYERLGLKTLPPLRLKQLKDAQRRVEGGVRHLADHQDRAPHWKRFIWRSVTKRVQITDQQLQRQVVALPDFKEPSEVYRFQLTSERGREYEVSVDLSWERSPYDDLVNRILSLQMVLILIVSSLGALIVSAIIARPLTLLREHTQAIYRGELDTRTDKKLRVRGDELGELARDFDRMADYVQQTLTSHQHLMCDVSHELRAPLARLQAAAGIAEQRLGEGDKTVQRIIYECQRLDQLIGEILSLSRLEQMEISGEKTKLSTVLHELLEDAQFSQQSRPFDLQMESDCEVELSVNLLLRALNNIVGNACKHTPESTPIELSVHKGECCEIRIRDHGPGVPEAQLEKLCEPFFRGESRSEGYGLGLSIAQRAVQRLGGELSLANHPQGGLEVRISLPCA